MVLSLLGSKMLLICSNIFSNHSNEVETSYHAYSVANIRNNAIIIIIFAKKMI